MEKRFTVHPSALTPAVEFAARRLATKPSNPAHACLMLAVDDGTLTVSAFSENATARATTEVEGTADGKVLVSGRLFAGLLKAMPDKAVTIQQDGPHLIIESGRFRAGLPLLNADDFPALPSEAPVAGRVGGYELGFAIRRAGVASDPNHAQAMFTGLRFDYADESLALTATDRYRGAQVRVPWDAETVPEDASLVPAAGLREAADELGALDTVTIGVSPGTLSMTTPARSLVMSTLAMGEFPARQLGSMFTVVREAEFSVSARELVGPLKRAALLNGRETNTVRITLTENTLSLAAGAADGSTDGDEEIDVKYDGPQAVILLNAGYLGDALASAPGDAVTVAFNPGQHLPPALLTSSADATWRHILVPLKNLGG